MHKKLHTNTPGENKGLDILPFCAIKIIKISITKRAYPFPANITISYKILKEFFWGPFFLSLPRSSSNPDIC